MRPSLLLAVLALACATPSSTDDAFVSIDAASVDAAVDPCRGITAARIETVAMLSHGRYSPAVERLSDGRVLIAGGFDFARGMTTSAEIYDPIARTLSPTGAMNVARNFASTTVIDHAVLVIGGFDGTSGSTQVVERYDEASASFVWANAMLAMGREAHTATLLPDGTVLLAGGLQARGLHFLSSVERYDPANDSMQTSAGTLAPPRGFHAAAWIQARRSVLLVGGDSGMGELASAVRWEIDRDDVVPIGNARTHAGKAVAAATLASGHVIVAGGASTANGTLTDVDDYDPATDRFTPAAPMSTRRMAHTLTALGDGRLVAIGGWSDSETPVAATASIEVRSSDGTWSRLPVDLAVARLDHRAVAIDACHVVVIGGQHAATGAMPSAPREVELVTIPP